MIVSVVSARRRGRDATRDQGSHLLEPALPREPRTLSPSSLARATLALDASSDRTAFLLPRTVVLLDLFGPCVRASAHVVALRAGLASQEGLLHVVQGRVGNVSVVEELGFSRPQGERQAEKGGDGGDEEDHVGVLGGGAGARHGGIRRTKTRCRPGTKLPVFVFVLNPIFLYNVRLHHHHARGSC